MTDTKPCRRCGKATSAEIPDDLKGTTYAPFLERIGVLCDECVAKDDERERAAEAELREADFQNRLRESRMPKTLRGLTWADLEIDDSNRDAVGSAMAWGEGQLRGLVLSGPVGAGKTYLAGAAANALLRRRNVCWFSAPRLMAQARAGFNNPAREEITTLLTKPSLALVLDDIDKISPTEYALDIFFELIDERVANETPLLVTTNLGYDELRKRFNEPIASRLKLCAGHRIETDDRRGK
jgi:DNA replication protein DnaC